MIAEGYLKCETQGWRKNVAYCLKYSAMCMQWKDKRDVRMLTTFIPNKDVIVKRRGKEKAVTLIIDTYNNEMGGIDLSDQLMSFYPLECKILKKWSKKCGSIWSIHVSSIVKSCTENVVVNFLRLSSIQS